MTSSSTILFEQDKWLAAVRAGKSAIQQERLAGLQRCCNAPLTPYVTEKSFTNIADKIAKNAYVDLRFYPNSTLKVPANSRLQFLETYTRILDLNKELSYSSALQRQLRKAQSYLKFTASSDIDLLFQFMQGVYAGRGSDLSLRKSQLHDAVKASMEGDFGKLIYALDSEGKVYGALWVVWDEQVMYYVAGARNEATKDSAAMSFLLDAAIHLAKQKGLQSFDFCGSSIEGIDRFFAGFGAERVKMLRVYQAAPFWWKWLRKGVRVIKGIVG